MAKRFGYGGMLVFGAAAAVLGGIAAYRHRREIEETIQDIADQLEAQEEDGFFSVDMEDLGEGPIVHRTDEVSEDDVISDPAAEEIPEA